MQSDEERQRELEQRIARIVAGGLAVRDGVADAVSAALAGGRSAWNGLGGTLGRIARGAAVGARQVTRESQRGVLRAVVDGVGDGLGRTALATRLAVEEAGRRGEAFARQDLERLARDLGEAGRQFGTAFGRSLTEAGDELAGQWDGLRDHAERTFDQVEPGLRQALGAVAGDPLGLAVDTAKATAAGARRAAGELLDAVSGLLGEAGSRLRRP
jgi:hypothetical protein